MTNTIPINDLLGDGGLTNVAVLSTDSNGNTVLRGADGASLLEFDAVSDNVIANVNLRTGALDTLLGLAGGAGEIGVATDVEAMVRYTGVAGQAKAFYRNNSLFTAVFAAETPTTISATSTVFTPLTLDGSESITLGAVGGLWDIGNPTEITLPASATAIYALEVSAIWKFAADGDGTIRRLRVEVWNGSAWVLAGNAVNIVTTTTCSATEACSGYATLIGLGNTGYNRFRISAASTAATAIGVSAIGNVMVNVHRLA